MSVGMYVMYAYHIGFVVAAGFWFGRELLFLKFSICKHLLARANQFLLDIDMHSLARWLGGFNVK